MASLSPKIVMVFIPFKDMVSSAREKTKAASFAVNVAEIYLASIVDKEIVGWRPDSQKI